MQGYDFWHKQQQGNPLFPDLLWSRPENRVNAGKLLIIGGNAFGFAAPAEAYAEAGKAGIGVAHVLLPDALKHTVGKILEAGDFAPSTPSGSFGQKALTELMTHAAWADGVLLAGDLGRNSETAVLLEKFVAAYSGQLTITKDAADYFMASPGGLARRADTTLVLSFAQVQKLASKAGFSQVFTFDTGIVKLIALLHDFTVQYPLHIIIKHVEGIFVASNGIVSSTRTADNQDVWRVKTAAHASVWWLQNPGKPFAALTTAVYEASAATAA
jgi:hypothetical protein